MGLFLSHEHTFKKARSQPCDRKIGWEPLARNSFTFDLKAPSCVSSYNFSFFLSIIFSVSFSSVDDGKCHGKISLSTASFGTLTTLCLRILKL